MLGGAWKRGAPLVAVYTAALGPTRSLAWAHSSPDRARSNDFRADIFERPRLCVIVPDDFKYGEFLHLFPITAGTIYEALAVQDASTCRAKLGSASKPSIQVCAPLRALPSHMTVRQASERAPDGISLWPVTDERGVVGMSPNSDRHAWPMRRGQAVEGVGQPVNFRTCMRPPAVCSARTNGRSEARCPRRQRQTFTT